MKKVLLGTSALVGMALISGSAYAQGKDEALQVHVGGQFVVGYGYNVQQDDNPGQAAYKDKPDGVQEDFLLNFLASQTFSNNVTAGFRLRFRGQATLSAGSSGTVKDDVVYIKSPSFGEVRLGDESDERRQKGYAAPQISPGGDFGSNSQAVAFINGPATTNATTANLESRATKINYLTPTFQGFQLAFSYAPDRGTSHRIDTGPGGSSPNGANSLGGGGATSEFYALNPNSGTSSYDNSAAAYNYRTIAGSWDGAVGDFKIGVGGGYTTASANLSKGQSSTQNADPQVWNLGGEVDYGPWAFGGAFEEQHSVSPLSGFNGTPGYTGSKTNELVHQTFDVGFTYKVGALTSGIAWSRGMYEGVANPLNLKQVANNDVIVAGTNYLIGPGVSVTGELIFNNYDPGGSYHSLSGLTTNASNADNNIYAKSYNSVTAVFGTSFRF